MISIITKTIINQSIAFRQIEYAYRLSDHLINNLIVSTNKSGTIHTAQVHVFLSCHRFSHIRSVQRKQLILLKCNISTDIQLHIFCFQRSTADCYFKTSITHCTQIGKQSRISKRRNLYIIIIQ